MTDSLKDAEQMVVELIAPANQAHTESTWSYELTSEVENIEVGRGVPGRTSSGSIPCWLRYVVSQGEFEYCVADEIKAWYLLAQLTGSGSVTTVA